MSNTVYYADLLSAKHPVSAQAVEAQPMEAKLKSKPAELLMDVIGFDEAHLEANRSGQLSDGQRSQWEAKLKDMRLWRFLAVLAGIAGIAGIFVPLVLFKHVFGQVFSLVAGAVFVFLILQAQISPLQEDYEADFVPSVEGRVRLDITNKQGQHYEIYIRKQKFEVTKKVFLAFKNGDPYVIYYAANIKKILSVEWLRD